MDERSIPVIKVSGIPWKEYGLPFVVKPDGTLESAWDFFFQNKLSLKQDGMFPEKQFMERSKNRIFSLTALEYCLQNCSLLRRMLLNEGKLVDLKWFPIESSL